MPADESTWQVVRELRYGLSVLSRCKTQSWRGSCGGVKSRSPVETVTAGCWKYLPNSGCNHSTW